ncbi:FAD/FMN-containing dehydrogenase [Sphingobium sp. OAS761]|uniref:FAD-binding oxidoreductase n=1 Tax=Sphingobium sp. OAS761 TaxID=2817901 RepID=UPI00209ED338|nr:FAD-binding oxidoreductase [Sphingobium sp. OAS761]MCP1471482.1 FAD/FMN-containing dehydrogenase [Sphingobium sp. OAS761]
MTDIRAALSALLGERHVQTDGLEQPHSPVIHGATDGASWEGSILVKPGSTAEVADLVKLAAANGWPVIAVGGRTGTVGGTDPLGPSILLSLERLNRIDEIDLDNMTATVGAGVLLQTFQEAVEEAGAFFPLDIGARGSATIGGVISTNAGGTRAVKWGVTRDLVLGVEAVLADGRIVDGLRKLLKNNAGYDWTHLMIGSEGTLGIVTRAVLRLRPQEAAPITALLACPDFPSAISLLRRLETATSSGLGSFELMWGDVYDFITGSPVWQHQAPIAGGAAFYALVEVGGGERQFAAFEGALETFLAEGLISDAVIAQSIRQQEAIWATRDDMSPLGSLGPILPYDVSVPITAMGELADRVAADVRRTLPDARLFSFGHAGDGNLHFVVAPGRGREGDAAQVDRIVFSHVAALNGSIAAEHGIGIHRREAITYCRSPEELSLMRQMKQALDPAGILNPGKILPRETR